MVEREVEVEVEMFLEGPPLLPNHQHLHQYLHQYLQQHQHQPQHQSVLRLPLVAGDLEAVAHQEEEVEAV